MSGVWQNALNRDQEGKEKLDRMEMRDGKNKKIICGFRQITAEKERLETQNTYYIRCK